MSASFGIDHPLIAVSDINTTRERFIAMGFNMTPVGKHPWGTCNTLAMFDSCLIEIISLYDNKLLDEKPAGDFRFGRHVYDHLQLREGIALTALHSTDINADMEHAVQSGCHLSGCLEFGREVTLPDGTSDRTKTSLALLPDKLFPRLSFFLCQQHKPALIYVPEWLNHPNTAYGYKGVTIRAEADQQPTLRKRLAAIYAQVTPVEQGFRVQTANGSISVQSLNAIEEQFFTLPAAVRNDSEPAIVAMQFRCQNLMALTEHLDAAGINYTNDNVSIVLTDASSTGNTIFSFVD